MKTRDPGDILATCFPVFLYPMQEQILWTRNIASSFHLNCFHHVPRLPWFLIEFLETFLTALLVFTFAYLLLNAHTATRVSINWMMRLFCPKASKALNSFRRKAEVHHGYTPSLICPSSLMLSSLQPTPPSLLHSVPGELTSLIFMKNANKASLLQDFALLQIPGMFFHHQHGSLPPFLPDFI